jgi:hypothetical protein
MGGGCGAAALTCKKGSDQTFAAIETNDRNR